MYLSTVNPWLTLDTGDGFAHDEKTNCSIAHNFHSLVGLSLCAQAAFSIVQRHVTIVLHHHQTRAAGIYCSLRSEVLRLSAVETSPCIGRGETLQKSADKCTINNQDTSLKTHVGDVAAAK